MDTRVAQRGNVAARWTLEEFVGDLVARWIEEHPALRRWQGHPAGRNATQVPDCIRRYRFTGSAGYVYATLLYAWRGLPLPPLSLDAPILGGDGTRYDRVAKDPGTGEVAMFRTYVRR